MLLRSRVIDNRFDPDVFDNPSRLTLCFDLRDENRPMSGLVLNQGADTSRGQHIVVVPFASIEVQNNGRLLTTWGSHGTFTLLTYMASDRTGGSNGVGFQPRLPFYTPDQINIGAGSRDFVYVIRAGLERRFIYKFPRPPQEMARLPSETLPMIDNIDSIGVAVPANVEFREVRPGFSETPSNEYTSAKARFYTASADKAKTDRIELRYAFRATDSDTLYVELLFQLVTAIFIPIVALIFLSPKEVKSQGWRQLLIWGGIILQLVIITGLVAYIWFTHEPGESEIKAFGTAAIAVIGAVLGAVVGRMKVRQANEA